MAQAINPGQCNITKLHLKPPQGEKINLQGMIAQIDIFESIKYPSTRMLMIMRDSTGLTDKVGIVGSEIEISFSSYNNGAAPVDRKFKIEKLSNVQISENGREKTFVVHCCTSDWLASISSEVTEIYEKMSIENMIVSIYDKYIGPGSDKKKVVIEPTLGVDTVTLTKMNPFQAIDKLRQRAISGKNKSSSYCFFERQNEYVFSTIEKILDEGSKDPAVKSGSRNFFLDHVARPHKDKTDWRTILGYEQIKVVDATKFIGLGGLRRKVVSYNLETGEYDEQEFDVLRDTFNISGDSYDGISAELKQLLTSQEFNTKVSACPIPNGEDIERVKKEAMMTGYVLKLLTNMINIKVNGDSELSVGDVVYLNLPVPDSTTVLEVNEQLSGSYLITKCRHMVKPSGQSEYFQSFELLKAGFLGD